jgi:hypothetical protein
MKKIIMAFGVVALIAGTSSCKKDRVCTCTYSSTEVGFIGDDNDTDVITILDSRKKDARQECLGYSVDHPAVPADYWFAGSAAEAAYTTSETCELK